jgi:hypothetical protein
MPCAPYRVIFSRFDDDPGRQWCNKGRGHRSWQTGILLAQSTFVGTGRTRQEEAKPAGEPERRLATMTTNKRQFMRITMLAAALFVFGSVASHAYVRVGIGFDLGVPAYGYNPGPGYVYVPSHYCYRPAIGYGYVPAAWAYPPYSGAVWVGPHWSGRVFVGGYWRHSYYRHSYYRPYYRHRYYYGRY